ncbi:MAG TPA: hypothetical protein PLK10_04205, partial [Ottowia sp.]|nr:hypothetical protein [Ottowia sp.]
MVESIDIIINARATMPKTSTRRTGGAAGDAGAWAVLLRAAVGTRQAYRQFTMPALDVAWRP